MTSPSHTPVPFGKYLLLDRINIGGMAEVWRAKAFDAIGAERFVAIKRILPNIAEDEDFITMFIDEAKISVQLNHANVAQIHELGRVGASYYIAMEYLAGKDLRALFERGRRMGERLPVPLVCHVVSRICEALDYAHRKKDASGKPLNIVHRDVSPQNVIISYEGEIKVIDFGIAKAANKASRTEAGILKGKFAYMSPEQVAGKEIDRRSDIFAIGICLHELLTGQRLFSADSDFLVLEQVREARVTPPSEVVEGLPPALDPIVMRALARDPDDRYGAATELGDALQRYLLDTETLYSRKDLAHFMRGAFTLELEKEEARLRELADLKPPEDREQEQSVIAGGTPPGDRTGLGAGPPIRAASPTPRRSGSRPSVRSTPVTARPSRGAPLAEAFEEDSATVQMDASDPELAALQPGTRGAAPDAPEPEDDPTRSDRKIISPFAEGEVTHGARPRLTGERASPPSPGGSAPGLPGEADDHENTDVSVAAPELGGTQGAALEDDDRFGEPPDEALEEPPDDRPEAAARVGDGAPPSSRGGSLRSRAAAPSLPREGHPTSEAFGERVQRLLRNPLAVGGLTLLLLGVFGLLGYLLAPSPRTSPPEGLVVVDVTPEAAREVARVGIGRGQLETPARWPALFRVAPGPTVVQLEAEGFAPVTRVVSVVEGGEELTTVNVDLEPLIEHGWLVVTAGHPDVELELSRLGASAKTADEDGGSLDRALVPSDRASEDGPGGAGPGAGGSDEATRGGVIARATGRLIARVEVGALLRVEARRAGYAPTARELSVVDPTSPHLLELQLEPRRHTVNVDSTPSGARVVVNGRVRGTTPLQLTLEQGEEGLTLLRRCRRPVTVALDLPETPSNEPIAVRKRLQYIPRCR